MYIERILSLNNGWSILTTQKNEELQDVISVLAQLSIDSIKSAEERLSTNEDSITYYITVFYSSKLRNTGKWIDTLPRYGNTPSDHVEDHLIKNGVSTYTASLRDLPSGSFSNNIYVVMPYYYNLGLLEVSIVLAPTTETKAQMLASDISRIRSILTEADCRAELARFGPLTSQVPVVLAFYSLTAPEEISIEEVTPLKIGRHTIERTIEFAPEFYQAGVGLLSYFGEVLRQKDPNTKAKVRIEQDGRTVRLHIESPAGTIETIEKELDQYALVISNQIPPESLLENRIHVMQLESKLATTQVELKNALDVKQLTEGFYSQQVRDLRQQVDNLTHLIATHLLQKGQVIELMGQQNSSHERIQMALLTHSGMLFKDLLQEASGNHQLTEAVSSLQHNLLSGIATIDIEDKLEQALATIKETKPGFLGRIANELGGAAYKASTSSAISWVTKWVAAHT